MDLNVYQYDALGFCSTAGIRLYDWQKRQLKALTAFDADSRPLYSVAGVSVPRGNGKTFLAAAFGLWRFAVAAPGDTLAASLGRDQAARMLRYVKAMVAGSRDLQRLVIVRREHLELRSTPYRFEIISREKMAARSPHYRTILFDEGGWVSDAEQWETLLAGQSSEADPMMLLTSTVGKRTGPLQTVQKLAEKGTKGIYWSHSTRNESPAVSKAYLARERKLLPPLVYSREHENTLKEGEDAFATEQEIKAAFAGHGRADADAFRYAFVDLATSGVASGVVCSKRSDGVIICEEAMIWKGSRRAPVQIAAVGEWIAGLSSRYTHVELVQVESWQGIATVQSLEGQGHPVEAVHQSAALKSQAYGNLQRLLIANAIGLPRSRVLQEELQGAVCEASETGLRVDGVPHPDALLSLAFSSLAATEQRAGPGSAMTPVFEHMSRYMAKAEEQEEVLV